MLSDELKHRIRALWDTFWSGGIANPLSAIEQISYLIFLKRLEDLDTRQALHASKRDGSYSSIFALAPECRWSYIREQDPSAMLDLVRDKAFPFIKRLEDSGDPFAAAMKDAVFIIPKPSLLARAVELIDQFPVNDEDLDAQGDMYEDLLGELSLAGKNGQFRTARHVVRTMVELVDPKLGEFICDPAAGTAGFLVGAFQWIMKSLTPPEEVVIGQDGSWQNLTARLLGRGQKRKALIEGDRFVGYDFDTTMVRLGLMNMLLHGIRRPHFFYRDALSGSSTPLPIFDVILANPPFTGSLDKSDIHPSLATLGTRKTELLFVELCIQLLKPGGRCGIVLPEGVLFASTKAHRELRRRLVEENGLQAVISLPSGVFRPYTGVKTAILLFQKGGRTQNVWFYEVSGDGRTLDDKRTPDPENDDLRFVPQAFREFRSGVAEPWSSAAERTAAKKRQWLVTRKEIASRDYMLAASIHRAPSREPHETTDPRAVLRRVRNLEVRIQRNLRLISKALNRDSNA